MTVRALSPWALALACLSALAACGASPRLPSPLQSAEIVSRCEPRIVNAGHLSAKVVHLATYNMSEGAAPKNSPAGVETFTISAAIKGTGWKCVIVGDPQKSTTWTVTSVSMK